MPSEEIKTEQLKIGAPLLVKLLREFGFPTVVALSLAAAFFWYARTTHQERLTVEARQNRKINEVLLLLKQQKGCPIVPQDLDE